MPHGERSYRPGFERKPRSKRPPVHRVSFDSSLESAMRNSNDVLLTLSVSQDFGSGINYPIPVVCKVLAVDKYFIKVVTNEGSEEWINKGFILRCQIAVMEEGEGSTLKSRNQGVEE